jgi:hypothetical protein
MLRTVIILSRRAFRDFSWDRGVGAFLPEIDPLVKRCFGITKEGFKINRTIDAPHDTGSEADVQVQVWYCTELRPPVSKKEQLARGIERAFSNFPFGYSSDPNTLSVRFVPYEKY